MTSVDTTEPPSDRTEGPPPSGILGRSPAIRRVLTHVERVARAPRTTVLITGESGVGKELVARAVHDQSERAQAPFVALNCAAFAEGLLEAELFGYEPGAFTGGNPKGHDGLLASAEDGTLLLDEIGELDPKLQAKLLRVLQERTFRRVGGNRDLPFRARVLASTHRDLLAMVDEGSFREDLYYRLNVLTIHVPPLRERPEDVDLIADAWLRTLASQLGREALALSPSATSRLQAHPFPGNVRELKNALERAAVLSTCDTIEPEHLALDSRTSSASGPALTRGRGSWNLKRVEEEVIRHVLSECGGNRSQTARELGINRATLYNKLRSYGIAN